LKEKQRAETKKRSSAQLRYFLAVLPILLAASLVYRIRGDLFGDQRFTGTWTWLGSQGLRILIPPRIPWCLGFEIRVGGYAGRYFPTGAASNRFLVSPTVDQMQRVEIDETWQVANGRLSRVGEDGVVDKVWAPRKLSKK
jgi:hypothetical protein